MGDFRRIYKSDLTDRQLMDFWRLARASGRDRAIGYDMPPMDGPAFCRWMRREDVHPWLVQYMGVTMGMYYLTNRQGKTAHVHFLTLPCGTHRTKDRLPVPVAAGLFALGSALWEKTATSFMLDTLIGITPTCNEAAVKFILRCGAVECGTVPNLCFFHDEGEHSAGLVTVFNRASVPDWTAKL